MFILLKKYACKKSVFALKVPCVLVMIVLFVTQPLGDLGEIDVASDGRADFRLTNERIKVWEMIGRSIVVHRGSQDCSTSDIRPK